MKISVAGMGYAGLSSAVLLAQQNTVTAVDLVEERVDLVNNGKSPIADPEIEAFLAEGNINLTATTDGESAYKDADFVVIATPTNYDTATGYFDTASVDSVIALTTNVNPNATIIIKSTIPVGYTAEARQKFNNENIIFSPEFLREGRALYDNLHPSRIIVGDTTERAKTFAKLLQNGAKDANVPTLFMDSAEAEAVKLFANTYLAMRVAFFNELDTYAELKGMNAANIIKGVSLDERIGDYHNNPSFGYGGYCLPKDSKQLLANYSNVPNDIIRATVKSNATRMDHIAEQILAKQPKTIGAYRLAMKSGSDNFRDSSIQGIIARLRKKGANVVIYEPHIAKNEFEGIPVIADFAEFKQTSDVIIANRMDDELRDVGEKLYTRDVFARD